MTPAKRILFSALTILFLLSACAPAPAPTQDPAEIQRQIEQSVALTVAAQSAQTEQAQALIPEPTNTPLPTQTEAVPPTPTFILPTATPFVVVPPTQAPVTGGGNPPAVPDYACNIINQSPRDNSIWKQNKDFDINWTIVNTGKKPWRAGLDLVYYSGTNFAKTTLVELPAMNPGDKHTVILDAVTPSKDGFYVMTWKLEGGFCFPYIAINVEQ
jgi:hypothetical protein